MTSAATTSRSKVKIAHIADMQFGSGYSLGHEDQGGVNSRLKDADVCWQRAVGRMISEPVDLVVIDSVAALTPKAELEGEMGDSHMGLQARLMSQATSVQRPTTGTARP